MSNIIVDGFGHYGTGSNTTALSNVMLAGGYASINGINGITTLPWAGTDPDVFLQVTPQYGSGARRVLPAGVSTTTYFSFYFAVPNLPTVNAGAIISFRDASNAVIAYLQLTTTGALSLYDANTTLISASNGPVIVAATAYHMELSFTPGGSSAGACTVNVAEATVITTTGVTWSNANNHAQFLLCDSTGIGGSGTTYYYAHLIVRNTSGTYNTGFIGDRKVATLIVNANGTDTGWTAQPLQWKTAGIMANGVATYPGASAANGAGVSAAPQAGTDFSNEDFTVEGMFRFQELPTGSNKAVFFSKWDSGANKRSWELYLGGPSLGNGALVWQMSTDGTSGTAAALITQPYSFVVGLWYHIAVSRASGSLQLFVNGVPLGTPTTDANNYYSGGSSGAYTGLCCEMSGSNTVSNTALNGWNDEFRISQSYAQYTTAFSPPTAAFPRGSGSDAHWSARTWLSGWDTNTISDDSSFTITLTAHNGAQSAIPADATSAYQTVNKSTYGTNYSTMDDSFVEAPLISASSIYTELTQPLTTTTVTIGTQDGSTPAVYEFQTILTNSYGHVLIGASLLTALTNLVNAINAGAGSGTTYAAATNVNHDVTAILLPPNQILIQAITPGTAGNALASTTTTADGSFSSGATLAGGVSIPGDSEFRMQSLPSGASVADSLTIVRRSWKSDAGACSVTASLVGVGGTAVAGTSVSESTTPGLHFDLFEADPDNSGNPMSVPAVNLCQIKINRTA